MATFPMRFKPEGVRQTKKAIKGLNSGVKGLGSSLLKIGGAIAVVKGLHTAVTGSLSAFGKQEEAVKKLNAVLASTGHASGMTSQELQNMASALQQTTKFGDEAIMGAQSLMLTFTQVGKEVMPNAIETVLNMSEAMGVGLKEQTIQLGKALNDPIQGISALSRVGVQLTDEQKDLIKSFMDVGDIAGAQGVILGELETQFGGMAKAAAVTFPGAMAQMKNALGDTAEVFGSILAPAVQQGAVMIKGFAEDATNALNFAKTVDWGATIQNVVKQSDLMWSAFKDIFVLYAQFIVNKLKKVIPDAFFGIIDFIQNTLWPAIKAFGAYVGEPIWIGIQILLQQMKMGFQKEFNAIKQGWVDIINAVISGYNTVSELFGAEPIQLFEPVTEENIENTENKIADLKERLAGTSIVQDLFAPGEEDPIDTFQELSDGVTEIVSNLGEKIVQTKQEVNPNNPKASLTDGAVGLSQEEVDANTQRLKIDEANRLKKLKADKKIYNTGKENFRKHLEESAEEFAAFQEINKAMKIRDILIGIPPTVRDAYAAGMKSGGPFAPVVATAFAGAALAAQMVQLKQIKKAEIGYDGLVTSPTMFLAGEKNQAEHVSVTPLNAPNIKGPQNNGQNSNINITFTGNVVSDEFIEEDVIPKLNNLIRQGWRLGEND